MKKPTRDTASLKSDGQQSRVTTPPTIGIDELVAEMARLGMGEDSEGFTAAEIAEKQGVGVKTVRQRLAKIAAKGKLKVGRRQTASIDGKKTFSPVYSIRS